jgi:hypothetical protein
MTAEDDGNRLAHGPVEHHEEAGQGKDGFAAEGLLNESILGDLELALLIVSTLETI